MAYAPNRPFERVGFGLFVVPRDFLVANVSKIKEAREVLASGNLPSKEDKVMESLRCVQHLFSGVYTGFRHDWYSVSRFLGHPSMEHCRYMAKLFANARQKVRRQEDCFFQSTAAAIEREHGFQMLDNFLDMADHAARPLDEYGWAYILWSSSERDALHVGAAGGKIEHVTSRLGREHPGHHPFGVMAAWRVRDPVAAFEGIRSALDDFALGGDFYRMELGDARDRVHALLDAAGNIVKSPWHEAERAQAHGPSKTLNWIGAVTEGVKRDNMVTTRLYDVSYCAS